MRPCLALCLYLLLAPLVQAQQQAPIVRLSVEPAVVAVGEPVRLRVTVLVPTWFSKPPRFPSFELANVVTLLPPNSSHPTSERIGHDSWSGIVRSYQLFPLTGATFRLSDLAVAISYVDPADTGRTIQLEKALPEVEFRGQIPVGAESLDPYIAGRGLQFAREIQGDIENLQSGDAVVLSYSAQLEQVPAFMLPPLAPELNLDGVSVYPEGPVVIDGEPARRIEKLTLVFDTPGEVVLPGRELRWWNVDSAQIETASVESVTLSIGGTVSEAAEAGAGSAIHWRGILLGVVGLGLLLFILVRLIPLVLQWLRAALDRYRQSEPYAFRALCKALAAHQPHASYIALLHWLAVIDPATDARRFASDHGNEVLRRQIDVLSESIYADSSGTPDFRQLKRGLVAARRKWKHRKGATARSVLPPLNA